MGQVKNQLIEILELAEQGYSVQRIADITGLTVLVVEYVIAEYGVAALVGA